MKKYKVLASYLTFCELEVEAENEDEAWELAREADGGSFEPDGFGDWSINDVTEIPE